MKTNKQILFFFIIVFSLSGCETITWRHQDKPSIEAKEKPVIVEEVTTTHTTVPVETEGKSNSNIKEVPVKVEDTNKSNELPKATTSEAVIVEKPKKKKKKKTKYSFKKTDYPVGIIGQVEPIYIHSLKESFSARIDTGATTSSLDARNIKYFERNGKKWVRFEVPIGKEVQELELAVVRIIGITQHEGDYSLKRPVVRLTISMGDRILKREFSLANRSEFDYPMLIGRNVLLGEAIVDVSKKNTLKKYIKDE